MKKILLAACLLGLFILGGCKGSKDVQGEWYAVNSEGREIKLEFTEDTVTFSAEGVNSQSFSYKQTGTGFKNSTSYKSLEWDGTTFSFVFPDKKDKENAIILIPDSEDDATAGNVYWVLSKDDYPDFDKYK